MAETVAVEKARDFVVLQRTQQTLENRAKQSTDNTLSETEGGAEGEERDDEGEKQLVELIQENEKLLLENQDLKDTVKLMEDQISQFKQVRSRHIQRITICY